MPQAENNLIWRIRWVLKSKHDLFFLPRLIGDKRSLDSIVDIGELVKHLCKRKRRKGTIRANQDPVELKSLYDLVSAKMPRVVVEIGTSKGGTLFLWSRAGAPGALLVSIDLPGGYGTVTSTHMSVYETFGQERGIHVKTLALNSHSPAAHREVQRILGNRKIDFLFIDGDHSYAGVKSDFFDYLAYMQPNGLIAMHDIAIPETHPTISVKRFWCELQARGFDTKSIVKDPGRSPGIGVIFLASSSIALDEGSRCV